MSTTADAPALGRLIATDPMLAPLGLLFNPDALAGLLGPSLRLHRLRYKPATSLHAALSDGAGWYLLAGYRRGAVDKLVKQRRAAARRRSPVLIEDAAHSWLVVPAGADRALRPAAIAETAAGIPIAYNPRRRLVYSGTSPNHGPWVAKVYAPGERRVDARLTEALVAAGVRTPDALLTHDRDVRRVRWQPGRAASAASGTDAAAVSEAIAALAAACPAVPMRRATVGGLLARVDAAARQVVTILPGRAGIVAAIRRSLRTRAELIDALGRVVVHGDLSPDQIVVDDDGHAWLLDLDRCEWGFTGWDQATWLASQMIDGVATPLPLPGPVPDPALLAAALVVRAPEPFARQHDGWVAATSSALDAAATLLGLTPGAADGLR